MSDAETAAPLRVVCLQVAASVLAAACALVGSFEAAKAALLGGMVAFLPNAYFAWATVRAGRRPVAGREEAVWAAGRMLGQWGAKAAMTVALLVAVIVVAKPAALAFVCGFGAASLAQLGAPLAWRLGMNGRKLEQVD